MGRVLIIVWMLGLSLSAVAQNKQVKKTFPKHTLVFTVYDNNDELDNIVSKLKEQPTAQVFIYGYTDNTGTYEVNQKVSLQRAEAVAKTLKDNGVDEECITTKGMSYDYPVADNSTAEGRAKNRRVEVYIVPK